jgi:hypothetical protein
LFIFSIHTSYSDMTVSLYLDIIGYISLSFHLHIPVTMKRLDNELREIPHIRICYHTLICTRIDVVSKIYIAITTIFLQIFYIVTVIVTYRRIAVRRAIYSAVYIECICERTSDKLELSPSAVLHLYIDIVRVYLVSQSCNLNFCAVIVSSSSRNEFQNGRECNVPETESDVLRILYTLDIVNYNTLIIFIWDVAVQSVSLLT